MTTTHPASDTTGGNRGLPITCPACNEPALQHDNGAIYCSDTDKTYSTQEMAAAVQAATEVPQ